MIVVEDAMTVPGPAQGLAVAIGNFDGVHRGHRAVLEKTCEAAAAAGSRPAVMVFEPHPRLFFQPDLPHFPLTPLARKLELLSDHGRVAAYVMRFDAALAAMPADAFIERHLVERLAVRHVVIGYDFFFGHRRSGTPETMINAGQRYGFGVTVVAPVAEGGEVFSSSAIRLLLAQGDVRDAARQLGANWRVTGRVVGGAKRGTGLGYPTANIPMPKGTALGHGIYAVRVYAGDAMLLGAAYLGTRPTFDDGMPVLEVFLFDFDGDVYGQEMTVEFVDFIRPDRKFDSAGDLVAQMDRDCATARAVLATAAAADERRKGWSPRVDGRRCW